MNVFRFLLILAASAATAGAGEDFAAVEGRVDLPPPPAPALVAQRYDIVTQNGVVATNPPLAVVYLEGQNSVLARPLDAVMAQKDLSFVPALLAIQTGTRVEFPNYDDTFHNVFSFSPTKRFDLGRYRPQDTPVPSLIFDQPGLVTLRCEIHKHMRGLILVLDTPYFIVTDPTGHYRMEHIPPGHYVLKAWLDSRTTRTQEIEVRAGETLHADLH